jgi:triacylglycerol esterase/lipase EstA (alpha/beta hydrolase family)
MRRPIAAFTWTLLLALAVAGPALGALHQHATRHYAARHHAARHAGPHAAAVGADPPLTVPRAQLAAALSCPAAFVHPARAPVLLVHGTGLTASESWSWNYANVLPGEGFDTCMVTLPDDALGDIQVSTQYVVYAVQHIAALTGRRVDVITHSQGGMEGRWAVRWWPSVRAEVDDMILLASPNHGIYAADACAASGNCWPAVWQMAEGAHFIHALNSGSEAPGSISYTNVYSLTDELVEPSSTVPLSPAPNVANVAVQSICPGRFVHHAGLLEDAVAHALVLDALTHAGPASPARIDPVSVCTQALMPGVSAADAAGGNAILYGDAVQAFSAHPGVTSEPPLAPYAAGAGT